MEALALKQLQDTKRGYIKALCDKTSLEKKMVKANKLQKLVCLREARRYLNRDILAMAEDMRNLQALLQLPADSMEVNVSNQLRDNKKKYIYKTQ